MDYTRPSHSAGQNISWDVGHKWLHDKQQGLALFHLVMDRLGSAHDFNHYMSSAHVHWLNQNIDTLLQRSL